MDLQMPEMNGLDAIIAIRGEFREAKIIVLTTYKGDVQILRALKAGARGYLLKNTFHKELLDTIRAVHAGKKALSPEASYEIAEHATDDALTPADGGLAGAAPFSGLELSEAPPDHSTISRTRRLIHVETHQAVFRWVLELVGEKGC
jgi:DNA-binding NarL/FixJ family response regulator